VGTGWVGSRYDVDLTGGASPEASFTHNLCDGGRLCGVQECFLLFSFCLNSSDPKRREDDCKEARGGLVLCVTPTLMQVCPTRTEHRATTQEVQPSPAGKGSERLYIATFGGTSFKGAAWIVVVVCAAIQPFGKEKEKKREKKRERKREISHGAVLR
jgi:hypothetical protein